MSADLLDIEDTKGNNLYLCMNVKRVLFITTSHNEFILQPNVQGRESDEKLVAVLNEWLRYTAEETDG